MCSSSQPAAPTATTVTNTNIPEYAQPYVSNMLNAAQGQIFTPDMKGFQQYTPYSKNAADYFVPFSPLQQQAMSSAANLQTPGQYGQASRATMAGMMGLAGTGDQMGQVGQNYANQATNPNSIQAYMNPYVQASLAPQLELARQQYGMAGQQQQANATQAGAFGGSREALMSGLNQQNQMLAQNQLINQGYNTAFQNAQQAQQFGANLGLQGLQGQAGAYGQAMQGAGQLAGIGGQQLAAQQGILGTQNQLGAADTAAQQAIKNQDIQNFATAQQYPYMQLGLMNSMLRGLPMQQSSTAMYQAPPSALTQVAGLGTAGLGAAAMYNQATKAGGGEIKSMANGGKVEKYGFGGFLGDAIHNIGSSLGHMFKGSEPTSTTLKFDDPNSPRARYMQDVANKGGTPLQVMGASIDEIPPQYSIPVPDQYTGPGAQGMAAGGAVPMKMMSDSQLKQVQQSPASSPMADLYAQGLQQLHGYMRNNPEAPKVIQPTGVASIPTGDMTQMADGGIVAFAKQGAVEDESVKRKTGDIDIFRTYVEPRLKEEQEGKNTIMELMKPQMEGIAEENKKAKAMMMPEFFTRLGLGMMNAPAGQPGSPIQQLLGSAGGSGLGALTHMGQSQKDIAANNRLLLQQGVEGAKGDQARRDMLTGNLINAATSQQNKELGLAQVAAARQSGIDAKQAALINAASTAYMQNVDRVFNHLATQEKNAFVFANHPEKLWELARQSVYQAMPEATRKLLALTPPTTPPPNPAPAAAAAPAAAPAAPAPVVRNQMPATPGGTMRWDPSANGGKGALVAG